MSERTGRSSADGAHDDDLARLSSGVIIDAKRTKPAVVRLFDREPDFPARAISIRLRRNVPTAWLEMTLREGRNRQVRKMTAAVGHPTLRLVRTSIAFLTLRELHPGEYRELTSKEIEKLYNLLLIS